MLTRMAGIEEEGGRDTYKEQIETKKREVYQMKKSEAIIKFESVMSDMLTTSLQRATVRTLQDCKKPIFNKGYENILD